MGVPARALIPATALVYFLLIGGTARGELEPAFRLLNAGLAAILLLIFFRRAPSEADRVDRGVLLGVLLIAAAGMFSAFPRQSFDAVLGVLTFAAALFVVRDVLAGGRGRAIITSTMIGLSAFVTLVTAARWISAALEWWSLTNWTVIPPLDISFNAFPWGHRHDLALFAVMLYPSWFVARRPGPVHGAIAAVIGVLTLAIVVLDGSRILWFAIAVATALMGVAPMLRLLRMNRGVRVGLVIAALAMGAGLVVTGAGGVVMERVLGFNTLGSRSAMWGFLTGVWLDHPLSGVGPGSFAWILQGTAYFDSTTWAPRHPDSMLFQLLPESGVLGIAAVLCIVAVLIPPLMQGRSQAARWALIVFAVTCIGANPTDFAFLVVLAAVWVGYLAPHTTRDRGIQRGGRRWPRFASAGALGLVATIYTATLVAGFLYEHARAQIEDGQAQAAAGWLDAAARLDPGLALYARQSGTVQWMLGDSDALTELRRATALNPMDDLAWRTLAMAYASTGDHERSAAALDRALDVQRSDPTNLLLSAYLAAEPDHERRALDALGQVVQGWPTIVGAAGWDDLVAGAGVATAETVEMAARRWDDDLPSPTGASMLTAILANRPDLIAEARDAGGLSETLATSLIASYRCDASVSTLLESASSADRRSAVYWALRVRTAALGGTVDETSIRLYEIMTGDRLDPALGEQMLNPLHENAIPGSADAWGYRRQPIAWPESPVQLPSPAAASVRWLVDPIAAHGAGLVPSCRADS